MNRRFLLISIGFLALILSVTFLTFSQEVRKILEAVVEGHMARPETLPFQDSYVNKLHVPAGFQIAIWAKNLGRPA
jgi:hypothetical protein